MESTLALLAASWAIAMALAPCSRYGESFTNRARAVSISYFVILVIGFGLWIAYGVAASNLALIVPNSVAAIVIVATIGVALRHR